jgi:hypothetical protein
MRVIGRDTARKEVYSSMTRRVSTAGIIAGVLLILFGMFTVAMMYFMRLPQQAVAGSGIFIVAGGAVITYSVLTRETRKKVCNEQNTSRFLCIINRFDVIQHIFRGDFTFCNR